MSAEQRQLSQNQLPSACWQQKSEFLGRYTYGIGAALFAAPFAFLLLGHLTSLKLNPVLLLILFAVGLACAAVGLSLEAAKFVVKRWNNRLAKWLISLTQCAIVGTASLVATRRIINYLVGTDPSHFDVALKLFPILVAPVAWIALIGSAAFLFIVGYIFCLDAVAIFGMFTGYRVKTTLLKATSRILGAVGLITITAMLLILAVSQESLLRNLLVRTDYVAVTECANVSAGEYVKDLRNGTISVAVPTSNGSYRFELRRCDNSVR